MKIAHLSDLHILALDGVSPLRFLNKRLTGYANLRLKRKHIHKPSYVRAIAQEIKRAGVDHVVITGDLTNLALESEFQRARTLLEDDLGLDAQHVSIVPGNHDLYTRGAMTSQRFSTYFADYMKSDLPELAVDVGVGRFPFVKLRGPVAIIGLSSAVPRLPFVAAGRLGKKQIAALGDVLRHPEVKKRTPIVLLHHPAHNPVSRVKSALEGLSDAALLWTGMRDVARGMVLHGHLHRRIQRALPTTLGHMHAVGATSASLHDDASGRMAGFNLYDIGDGTGEIDNIEAHVFRPSSGDFVVETVPSVA